MLNKYYIKTQNEIKNKLIYQEKSNKKLHKNKLKLNL